ncbi:MAG: transcriptional regulator [Gemmatimonadaceae bacterium]|nr:transcriptional regulator [Gemmatimonadaceae bacterium]
MGAKRATHAATATPQSTEPAPALRAVDGEDSAPLSLDRLIHERVRLAIVSALAVHDMLTFNELKALLDTTDGNLSVHARKLEDADYLACKKGFDGRIPRTEYRLTTKGRQALERYLSHMEALIRRVGERG